MGTADLHIHSIYSYDATSTVRAVLKQAADVGLNVIAVTDHDEIRGSLEAHELAPKYGIESIPAVEVSTKEGHLLALFVETLPPRGLTLVDTLIHIGKLGGVAIAPHPFNNFSVSLSMEAVVGALTNPRAKAVLKGIETHNMGTQPFDISCAKTFHLPAACKDHHPVTRMSTGQLAQAAPNSPVKPHKTCATRLNRSPPFPFHTKRNFPQRQSSVGCAA